MTFTQAASFMRATTSNSSNFSILSDRALTFRDPGRLHRELVVFSDRASPRYNGIMQLKALVNVPIHFLKDDRGDRG